MIKRILTGLAFAFVSIMSLSLLINGALNLSHSSLPTQKEVNSYLPPVAAVIPNKVSKTVTHLDLPSDRTISIYGEINMETDALAQQLVKLGRDDKPIYVVLKSPGGSVVNGAMFISAMESAKGPVYTICDMLCASMAALIFEHGTKRFIIDRSFVMFHPASGGAEGEIDKVVSRMNSIQRYIGKMEAYVAQRANITFEKYKELSGRELWLDGEDAVNSGFADGLVSYSTPAPFTSIPGSGNNLFNVVPINPLRPSFNIESVSL